MANFSKSGSKSEFSENFDIISGQNDYNPSECIAVPKQKPWYLENGTRYPKPARISQKTGIRNVKLLPQEEPDSDRILNQLMFIPPNYDSIVQSQNVKTILAYNDYSPWWGIKNGDNVFKEHKCSVNTCRFTNNTNETQTADLVLFLESYNHTGEKRPSNQLYALYHSENPAYTHAIKYPGTIDLL